MFERQVAIDAVLQAIQLCQRVQAEMADSDSVDKSDGSPVTVADFGSQAIICRIISDKFPDDAIVAEEDSQALRKDSTLLDRVASFVSQQGEDTSLQAVCDWIDRGRGKIGQRFWTLDPIDGTKGFLRGDQYAIALALIVNGVVQLGVLGCPNLRQKWKTAGGERGCLFAAERGNGTHMLSLDGRIKEPVRVSHTVHCLAESFESAHGDRAANASIARNLKFTEPPIRVDSQAKYGLIARGEASVYIRLPHPITPDRHECIWDHAAGLIVVEEAGGMVSDADGKRLDFLQGRRFTANRGIVATNGVMHPHVLEGVRLHSNAGSGPPF
ncbi:MAG: 3'(2'),5'-bisphosphate nucleotidase [Candidatus Poribacteria bacterium]|nr:3'(2'),5'-bisphosphate nucleotidase [Candidatus Poribacteria bacterium]